MPRLNCSAQIELEFLYNGRDETVMGLPTNGTIECKRQGIGTVAKLSVCNPVHSSLNG